MEGPNSRHVRAKIAILKGPIIDRGPDGFTIKFDGFRVFAKGINMTMLDIRDGDILTAYVEVLLKPPTPTGDA